MSQIARSARLRSTPFTSRVDALGVQGYTVYNHMLLATSFRGVEEDYRHLKEHVQVWDVSCERQVEIKGPDSWRLTQLMTCRDLSQAKEKQCFYAPLVDEDGLLVNDPIIIKLSDDHWWLSIADSDVLLWARGLARGFGFDVKITEPNINPVAIQGPKADELMARIFGETVRDIRFFRYEWLPYQGHDFLVARSGWSKQGGFEVYVDDDEIGQALWDELFEKGKDLDVGPGCPNLIERIEGGLYSYGSDMDATISPLHSNLDRYCHHDRDIDFLGKEALRRIDREGLRAQVVGLKIEGEALSPPDIHWPVYEGHDNSDAEFSFDDPCVGRVTSAAWSPDLETNIAFCRLPIRYQPGDAMTVVSPLGARNATVCAIPFV
ncbi:dimethylsulfoniopropionate demethylase [Gammaproteobacteria bacterium]|nr:dimethylsulfoniopropionate demethylase [Gammaproteobacteria bacterium]